MLALMLHVFVGLIAFGALPFSGLFFNMMAKNANVSTIRSVYTVAAFRGKAFGPLGVITGLLGFWVASVMGIPLSSGWLIATYVAWGLLIVIGFGYHARMDSKILALAQASSGEQPSPELHAAIHNPLETVMGMVSMFLWLFIFYLMFAKPF